MIHDLFTFGKVVKEIDLGVELMMFWVGSEVGDTLAGMQLAWVD